MNCIRLYLASDEEREIIRMNIAREQRPIVPLLKPQEVIEAQKVVEQIYVDEKMDRVFMANVLARPGTPSSSTWPLARRATRRLSTKCFCPTMV